MNCLICRGACCETFAIPKSDIHPPGADEWRWIRLHLVDDGRGYLEFGTACRELGPDGRCQIYEDRPNVCRVYKPGGADCLDTVRRRRTAAEYAAIREAGDPSYVGGAGG